MLGDNAERPRFVETLHRRGYRFIARVERLNGASGALVPSRSPPTSSSGSPFCPSRHLGEASAPESFAGGLTEELITQLGRLCADRLGVIARSSCHRVQRTDRTVREIGEALRAHYLVEGTVRTDGGRVRITAQLIEARGETQLWAESFERPLADCLLVQSDVATQIVAVGRRGTAARPRADAVDAARATSTPIRATSRAATTGTGRATRACASASPSTSGALTLDPAFATAHGALARATVAAAEYYVQRAARGV